MSVRNVTSFERSAVEDPELDLGLNGLGTAVYLSRKEKRKTPDRVKRE